MQACRDGPAHDAAGADVGDERDVTQSRQDTHVGDVGNPQLVRAFGGEPAFDEIEAGIGVSGRACGTWFPAAAYALETGDPHQAGELVTTDLPAGTQHRVVHLPYPVDAVVLLVDPFGLR